MVVAGLIGSISGTWEECSDARDVRLGNPVSCSVCCSIVLGCEGGVEARLVSQLSPYDGSLWVTCAVCASAPGQCAVCWGRTLKWRLAAAA